MLDKLDNKYSYFFQPEFLSAFVHFGHGYLQNEYSSSVVIK